MQRDAHCWRQLDTPNSAYFFRSRRRKQRRLCKMINWGRRQHWRDLSKNETCVERIYRCLIFPWLHTLASVWSHQNKQTHDPTLPFSMADDDLAAALALSLGQGQLKAGKCALTSDAVQEPPRQIIPVASRRRTPPGKGWKSENRKMSPDLVCRQQPVSSLPLEQPPCRYRMMFIHFWRQKSWNITCRIFRAPCNAPWKIYVNSDGGSLWAVECVLGRCWAQAMLGPWWAHVECKLEPTSTLAKLRTCPVEPMSNPILFWSTKWVKMGVYLFNMFLWWLFMVIIKVRSGKNNCTDLDPLWRYPCFKYMPKPRIR